MPDTPVEPDGGGRYSPDMETRVAILEHMAQATLATLERIERKFETIDRRFEMLDRRFEAIDRRFEGIDRHFEAVERRIDAMSLQHRADFRWLLGFMLAGWGSVLGALGGILGVMAHGFHWF
ncbi:MAG TPA: hypothetical protein VJ779_15875 [Acetobacteraceae bacterium]|jgi:hypothetical protein|nr:hypothetical protein [Acetobacteraceae bacterium]